MTRQGVVLALGAAVLWAAACGESFQSGGGEGGQLVQSCTTTQDCTQSSDPCTTVSCQNSTCVYVEGAENVPLPNEEQVEGDCEVLVCINGSATGKPDDDPLPSDTCKTFTCEAGELVQTNTDPGVNCGGTLECDGNGICAGCTSTSQCPTPTNPCEDVECVNEQCLPVPITNTPLPDDMAGDCSRPGCNADGNFFYADDNNDLPVDENTADCEVPTCENGNETVIDAPNASQCTDPVVGACCQGDCCDGTCTVNGCENGQGGNGTGGAGTGGMAQMGG